MTQDRDTQDGEGSSDFITRFEDEDQKVRQTITDKCSNIIQDFRDGKISKNEAGLLLNKIILFDNMNPPNTFIAIFFFFALYIFIYIIIIYFLFLLHVIAFLLSFIIFCLRAMAFYISSNISKLEVIFLFLRNLLQYLQKL